MIINIIIIKNNYNEYNNLSPYIGGYYYGSVEFPEDFPAKPPTFKVFTWNGRVKQDVKICTSLSDFHGRFN